MTFIPKSSHLLFSLDQQRLEGQRPYHFDMSVEKDGETSTSFTLRVSDANATGPNQFWIAKLTGEQMFALVYHLNVGNIKL